MLSPVGVILAGGAGRRLGGAKATALLCGRPLIGYPVAALQGALVEVAVLAKPGTRLPELPGVTIWLEPESPTHPLVGIREALTRAAGRPVLVCAADLPFIGPALVREIAGADPAGAPAVVASQAGALQPLLGCYQPVAAARLPEATPERSRAPLRELVAALRPRLIEVSDPDALFNVNSFEDLRRAEAMMARRGPGPAISPRPPRGRRGPDRHGS